MNDTEKTAVLALLTKYAKALRENDDDRALILEAEDRVETRALQMEQLKPVFQIFGFDVSKSFLGIRKAIGVADYNDALIAAGYDREFLNYSEEGPSVGTKGAGDGANENTADADKTVRDFALERLKAARHTGVKASEIRKFIENARSSALHEKTVGMTLYRLSQEGLARREGRTWFFVQEAKNPGGDTPGFINRGNKEGGNA